MGLDELRLRIDNKTAFISLDVGTVSQDQSSFSSFPSGILSYTRTTSEERPVPEDATKTPPCHIAPLAFLALKSGEIRGDFEPHVSYKYRILQMHDCF